MLLLLQDISSLFGSGAADPDRARLYRQSHCAVEGQRLLTLLAQQVTFESYQSGEAPVPEPLFVVTTHLPDALRISSGS
jgi:hypothetical protein